MKSYYESADMKPISLIFPLGLFALGARALLFDEWRLFGVACWILGALVTAWLVIAGFWRERANYYESVRDVLRAARDVDLEKMAALGLSSHDIKDSLHVDLQEGSRSRHFDLPVSFVKLQPLARGLLNGEPFSERRWLQLLTSSEFRALRATLKNKGLIEQVSELDARQGYKLTTTGKELMISIAEPSPSPS